MPDHITALVALAVSAFTSATILPGTSEALLLSLALAPVEPYWLLFLVASTANVAGSCVNWAIGRLAADGRRRLNLSEKAWRRAEEWYRRWGAWSLLLSWLPIVGDPLTIVAGLLRVRFPVFLVLVALAKSGRYLALLAAAALAAPAV